MSLWTPGGEHEVPREPQSPTGGAAPGAPPRAGRSGPPTDADDPLAGLGPQERAEAEAMVAEMTEARQRLAEVPAAVVIANHAMGLYELAAIHLSAQPPDLAQGKLAIDAFGALVATLEGQLGDDERTLNDALAQIRLAFVQLRAAAGQPGGGEPARGGEAP
ncbi:MAG: hypothetical protein HYX34_09480 [Actinobacteria bacterium]|nr:hypothetical protein [Actinomycetota bacterium]